MAWLNPERELELGRTLSGCPVADPDDLEVLTEALGDADDHVVDERPRQTMKRTVGALVARTLDQERRPVLADGDVARQRPGKGALRALDRDLALLHGNLDTRGESDR